MNRMNLIIGMFSVVAFVTGSVHAEVVTKVTIDKEATSDVYTMHDSGKLYFSNESLVLDTLGNGNIVSVELAKIERLRFSLSEISTAGVENILSTSPSISAYPSPTDGMVTLRIDKEGVFSYSIYSAGGTLVQEGKAYDGALIDLTTLPKGVYFLKVSGCYLKISKL
ncbi:MAG: T9SS type A sorting domain-containing protein [Paludibacteraceae bacterium]|nr:T9SS type A sorting domain-containing protein [Paludibacteraceae bacterium]